MIRAFSFMLRSMGTDVTPVPICVFLRPHKLPFNAALEKTVPRVKMVPDGHISFSTADHALEDVLYLLL